MVDVTKGKLSQSQCLLTANKNPCKHPFSLRVPSTDVRTYKQLFYYGEYEFSVDHPPTTIVDAGANIGLASLYFATMFPNAKIIALEPEKNNFELLKKNTRPYPNIIPIQAALWDKDEPLDLNDPGSGEWGFMTGKGGENVRHSVPGLCVETLMKQFNLDHIDIFKIDIEGAEKEVFSQTQSWIDQVNALIIELHEDKKKGCMRSFYCGSNGFDLEWQRGENIYLSRANFMQPPTA